MPIGSRKINRDRSVAYFVPSCRPRGFVSLCHPVGRGMSRGELDGYRSQGWRGRTRAGPSEPSRQGLCGLWHRPGRRPLGRRSTGWDTPLLPARTRVARRRGWSSPDVSLHRPGFAWSATRQSAWAHISPDRTGHRRGRASDQPDQQRLWAPCPSARGSECTTGGKGVAEAGNRRVTGGAAAVSILTDVWRHALVRPS